MTRKPKEDPVEQLMTAMHKCAQARGAAQRTGKYAGSDRADAAFRRLAIRLLATKSKAATPAKAQ
jgi:hypothetical protein